MTDDAERSQSIGSCQEWLGRPAHASCSLSPRSAGPVPFRRQDRTQQRPVMPRWVCSVSAVRKPGLSIRQSVRCPYASTRGCVSRSS